MTINKKHRLGFVSVSEDIVFGLRPDAECFFAAIRVVGVEYNVFRGVFTYKAACASFDEVDAGQDIPRYTATIRTLADGGHAISWERMR